VLQVYCDSIVTLQTRQLQKRAERQGDADSLSWLLAPLNGRFDIVNGIQRAGAKRVEEVLRRFQYLDESRLKLRPLIETGSAPMYPKRPDTLGGLYKYRRFLDEELESLNTKAGEVLRETNELLKRYKRSPVMRLSGSDHRFHDSLSIEDESHSDAEYHERLAIWVLTKLLQEGNIARIRRCKHCVRWFFAMTDHQRSCSENCRKQGAAVGEEFKLKRKLYMRKYRSDEKEREARSKG
jgi:hypothetical protein